MKITIFILVILISNLAHAKNSGGGSFGQVKTFNKFGEKKVITNSKNKAFSFNPNDICQKYIYIDTMSSYRHKGYIWGIVGDFLNGYATTEVTSGNDSKQCKRTKFNVPYLSINQVDTKDRRWLSNIKDGEVINQLTPATIVKHHEVRNSSSIRLDVSEASQTKYYDMLVTEHEVKFKDGTLENVFISQ